MMKFKNFNNYFSFLLLLIVLAGCKATTTKTVEAVVGKITEPVSVVVTPDLELGEILTSDEGVDVTIAVSNNSSDEIRNLTYTFDNSENIFDYRANIEGVSTSPGAGGTCQSTLKPGVTCVYRLVLTPRKQGEFNIPGKITYLNRVEPQEKILDFHLISGEPASLTFTNDKSNYSFGTFEQTEAIARIIDFEVQNNGGLPAKSLSVSINNDDLDGAYELISHNCPSKLGVKAKCQVKLSYTPRNNDYTDPETIFTGQLRFDYIKDPMGNSGLLNGYLSFTSSTIEAKFKTNYAQIDFGTVVTGNKEPRNIKLTNMGYREGILKELILRKPDTSVAAICTKGVGTTLYCEGKSLYAFPFVIEDSSNCFENPTVSYLADSGSPSCIFKITYWPSADYLAGSQTTHNFNSATIDFKYDSQWKGSSNIVTKANIFNIIADFKARAKLIVAQVDFNLVPISGGSISQLGNNASIQLGRLAKIAAGYTSIFYPTKLYFQNVGEVNADFIKLDDGKTTPNTLIHVDESTPGASIARDFNEYYKGIKQETCLTLSPSSTCSISFNLSPFKKASEAIEDDLMYDDITDPFNKFKTFNFYYTDGSSFDDNGDAVTSRNFKSKIYAQLIAKGKLNISPLGLNFGGGASIVNGDKAVQNLILKNIGTGKIAALQYNPAKTLEVPSANILTSPTGAATGINQYPYRLSTYASNAEPLPGGVDKDCLDIIRGSTVVFPFVPDPLKILNEGESCAFRIEAKLPKNASTKDKNFALSTDEYRRPWMLGLNNTEDIWMDNAPGIPSVNPKFDYWDGDDNSVNDPGNSSPYFGYKNTSTDAVALSSSWKKGGALYISRIEPIASSVLYRPSITYPNLSDTFPHLSTTTGTAIPEQQFLNSDLVYGVNVAGIVQRSTQIKAYYDSFGSSFKEPAATNPFISMGATKINTDHPITISFGNLGNENPSEAQILDAGGDAGFTLIKFSSLTGVNVWNKILSGTSGFDVSIKLNQATAGEYQHCYDVVYKVFAGTRTYRFCLFATVKNTLPNLKIEYKNNDIAWNTNTLSFDITPDASWSLFKSPQNKLSTCTNLYSFYACESTPTLPDEIIGFSSVFSSFASCSATKNCQFDMKTIKITNTGTDTVRDFNLDTTKMAPGSYAANSILYKMDATKCANPTHYFNDIQNKIAVCQSEINSCNNLLPGNSCTLNFIYAPGTSVSPTSDSSITISYQSDDRTGFTPNAYSYINQYIPIKYESLAAATAVAYQYMRKGTTDGVNDTGTPVTASAPRSISSSETANNWSNPLIPVTSESQSYPISIDTYANGYNSITTVVTPKYIVDNFPKTMTIYVNVKTASATRISFLKANPNPIPSQWNQVYPVWNQTLNGGLGDFDTYPSNYGSSKATIYANDGCFYGEVKNDVGVPANNKGFNLGTDSMPASKCQLKIEFRGDFTYSSCNASTKAKTESLGGDIDYLNCNPYVFKIPYWSYKRSTEGIFKLHFRDFMEPPRSSVIGSITNLKAEFVSGSNARVKFDLPATIDPEVPTLGSITKYRIFWAKDAGQLKVAEIFKKSPSKTNFCWQDTANATLPQTITLTTCSTPAYNITTGRYWFVKVMAIRSISGHPNSAAIGTFTSDPKIPIVMVATPNNTNFTYVDQLKSLFDHGLIDTGNTYTYTNAVTKCSSSNLAIANNASNLNNPRSLINFSAFSYIRSGTVQSSLTGGYTAMGPGYVPHWLLDAATPINGSSVKLYDGTTLAGGFPGFNTAQTAAADNYYKISYSKTCANNSCINLNVVAGGDNDSTFAEGVFYTYPTNKAAFVRCYIPLVCPIKTSVKMTDASCNLKY